MGLFRVPNENKQSTVEGVSLVLYKLRDGLL